MKESVSVVAGHVIREIRECVVCCADVRRRLVLNIQTARRALTTRAMIAAANAVFFQFHSNVSKLLSHVAGRSVPQAVAVRAGQ